MASKRKRKRTISIGWRLFITGDGIQAQAEKGHFYWLASIDNW